uniref:Uncharacterized protein n=1 Tax=Ditylenchus dipsaci TaxID=166011 RepID=A0A915EB53_9BILA
MFSIVTSVVSEPTKLDKKFDYELGLPAVATDDFDTSMIDARNKKFFQPYKINMPYFTEIAQSRRPAFLPTYNGVFGSRAVQYRTQIKRSPQPHKIKTRALEDIKNCYFSPVQCYLLERRRRRSVPEVGAASHV